MSRCQATGLLASNRRALGRIHAGLIPVRTVSDMTPSQLPSLVPLSPEVRTRILNYVPRVLTTANWTALRPGVVDLVARCEPRTTVEARVLCSNLCALMSTYVSEIPTPSVPALFNELNVSRYREHHRRSGASNQSLAQRKSALSRLLSAQAGLPAKAKRRSPGTVVPAALSATGYTDAELAQLRACADAAPAEVGKVIRDALLIGVGFGIVSPVAATMVKEDTGLRAGTKVITMSATDDACLRSVAGFDRGQWDEARAHVAGTPGAPALLVERLRASWLVSVFRPRADQSALAQILTTDGIGWAAGSRAFKLLRHTACETDLRLLREA